MWVIRWWCDRRTCWVVAPWKWCFPSADLKEYITSAVQVSNDSPVLLDRFLDIATEVDVDIICDGKDVLVGGIMEHIEQAGVHSGDSSCILPPATLERRHQKRNDTSGYGAGQGAERRGLDEHPVCHSG